MARAQSRYQRGLSYEPGMATSRYTPGRSAAELGGTGDYTGGVTPIAGGSDGGGVTVPTGDNGSGNGLGSGNVLASLALAALSNPSVLNWAGRQLGLTGNGSNGSGAAAATVAGRPLDSGISYEALTSLPQAASAAEIIAPWSGSISTMGTNGVPVTWNMLPDAASVADGASGVLDGGLEGAAGSGIGSWLTALQGTAFPVGTTGIEGVLGSGLLGNGLDLWSGGASLLGGALGNYIVQNTPMEGRRDGTGKSIGAGLGAAAGGILLGPVGALLGSVIGGGIGGQIGPMATVGPNWGGMNVWSPDGQGGGHWAYQSGADNGGRVNDSAAQAFQQALLAYAQQQGYEINPLSQGAAYTIGQYSGGPNAPGEGWYYQAGAGPTEGIQRWFGDNLGAPAQGFGGMTGGSNADAMLSAALQDLVGQGLYVQSGSSPTGVDLTNALTAQAQAQQQQAANWSAQNNAGSQGG